MRPSVRGELTEIARERGSISRALVLAVGLVPVYGLIVNIRWGCNPI